MKPQPVSVWGYGLHADDKFKVHGRIGGVKDDFIICPHGAPGNELWVREAWRVTSWHDGEPMTIEYKDGATRAETSTGFEDNIEEWIERIQIQCGSDYEKAGIRPDGDGIYFLPDGMKTPTRWRPSIHMPRWASRIQLLIKDIRVERVQEISEADAKAEGCDLDWYADNAGSGEMWPCPTCKGWGVHGALGNNLGVTEADCVDCNTSKKMFQHLWNSINQKRGFGWDTNPHVWVIDFERIKL